MTREEISKLRDDFRYRALRDPILYRVVKMNETTDIPLELLFIQALLMYSEKSQIQHDQIVNFLSSCVCEARRIAFAVDPVDI
jgi:hypothetical protein